MVFWSFNLNIWSTYLNIWSQIFVHAQLISSHLSLTNLCNDDFTEFRLLSNILALVSSKFVRCVWYYHDEYRPIWYLGCVFLLISLFLKKILSFTPMILMVSLHSFNCRNEIQRLKWCRAYMFISWAWWVYHACI